MIIEIFHIPKFPNVSRSSFMYWLQVLKRVLDYLGDKDTIFWFFLIKKCFFFN